jgi:hypothetical protein
MKKFYPSSSAFMVGDLVVTKYNSGCLRSILIQSHGIREGSIPQLYIDCGATAEEQHQADLKAAGIPFIREMVIKAQLTPNVEYSGCLSRAPWWTRSRATRVRTRAGT